VSQPCALRLDRAVRVISLVRAIRRPGTRRALALDMNNFESVEHQLLITVSGGGTEASGEVALPAGASAKAGVKITQDPVKQYGSTELLACKQQASDNFGAWYQSGARLDRQLADCDKQFGKPAGTP
jgi:hypothetical protein